MVRFICYNRKKEKQGMTREKKKKNSWIYRIMMLILICIIGFSLYKIGTILYEYYIGTKEYNQTAQLAGADGEFDGNVDFAALLKKNKDVKAWIYSKDTPINYPILQSKDNDFYLYRMMNKEWNGKGSLFIDYRNEKPFEDFNTIIYGHRMKDGSMFHSLIEYRDKEYYNKHKKMMLITPKEKYDLIIFGVVTIPADSDMYKLDFYSDQEKQNYLDWIIKNNETDMGVKASAKDKIVMMSTCTYEYDDARLVVYGKLVEK